jgi:hypothetical protein
MMEQSDAVDLRRRRRFLVDGSLVSILYTALGILMVLDGDRFGYIASTFFGVCAVNWTRRLLTPPAVLLELPAHHFSLFAPSEARGQHRQSDMQPTKKPTLPKPEPTRAKSGVWDRELDCTS